MSYIAKVSLPGIDVKSATPEECVVHSQYPPLKAKLNQSPSHIATVRVDFGARTPRSVDTVVYKIRHGYSYKPFTLSNITFTDPTSLPGIVVNGIGYAGVGGTLEIRAFADETFYYITVFDDVFWTSSSSFLEVSYFIFTENGT